MATPLPPGRMRFGVFELDLSSGELRKHGIKIKLHDQPFKVLAMLLERPGEVVTREELHRRLWPADTFVDFDVGLNSAIKKLRDALGDSAEAPRYIETLPRRGYRVIPVAESIASSSPQDLTAHVKDSSAAPPSTLTRNKVVALPTEASKTGQPAKLWIAAGVGAAVLLALLVGLNVAGSRQRLLRTSAEGRIRSIAVLPLENLSGDTAQEYFADGMTEALITDLGKIGELRVISRTSAMHYKGTRKTLPEIARELNVDAVIEGAVLRSGDRVRITAQLVQAASDRHLWAESYERDLRDVLALQDELARAVADEVKIKLSLEEPTRLASARPVNPEAYDLYLRGRYFWNQRTGESLQKSIEFFQRALERDPNYALAWVGLADVYNVIPSNPADIAPQEAFPKARRAAERALQLDDSLAEAHSAMGNSLTDERAWGAAEREFQRAIELDPRNPVAHYFYGFLVLAPTGRFHEAVAELKKSLEVDPLALIVNSNLGRLYFWQRQYDRALQQYRRTLEIEPGFAAAHALIFELYEWQGNYKKAIEESRSIAAPRPILPGVTRDSFDLLHRGYLTGGPSGYWQARLDLAKKASKKEWVSPANLALIYAHLGQTNTAFEWLTKGVDQNDAFAAWMNANPSFDIMRPAPRFAALVRKMGLQPLPLPPSQ